MTKRVLGAVTALTLTLTLTMTLLPTLGAQADPDQAVSQPREDAYYPEVGDPSVDVLHYDLRLDWRDRTRTLVGVARLRFRSPRDQRRVQVDLARQLEVASVRLDGDRVRAVHRGKDLVVDTGAIRRDSRHVLRIAYRGRPEPYEFPGTRGDIPGLGWTVTRSGQVWTMQEPYGAFTWYPSNDHPSDKATYDISVTSRADWVGVANGRLLANRRHGDRRTTSFRLRSPAASYLVTVAIGPYRRYRDTGPHGLPISYWVRPSERDLLPMLRRTPAMIRWIEGRLGRYPFDRIGAVVVPSDSAMETQTLVTMGTRVRPRGPQFRSVLLHEYVHQWYGDTVTPSGWRDLWLNESFTMYLNILWEIDRGIASRRDWLRFLDESDQYFRDSDGPPGSYKRRRFGSGSVYYSGARMLVELRERLGGRRFDRMLRAWPQRRRFDNADRDDWIRFAERFTGRPLERFVDRWLDARRSPPRSG